MTSTVIISILMGVLITLIGFIGKKIDKKLELISDKLGIMSETIARHDEHNKSMERRVEKLEKAA